mgnify:CR=1 FL=1
MIDPRCDYWDNEYIKYWTNKIGEDTSNARNKNNKGETDNIELYSKIISKHIKGFHSLDAGCGWGRLFPLILNHSKNVSGIDISEDMIKQCRKNYIENNNVKYIYQSTLENIWISPLP